MRYRPLLVPRVVSARCPPVAPADTVCGRRQVRRCSPDRWCAAARRAHDARCSCSKVVEVDATIAVRKSAGDVGATSRAARELMTALATRGAQLRPFLIPLGFSGGRP